MHILQGLKIAFSFALLKHVAGIKEWDNQKLHIYMRVSIYHSSSSLIFVPIISTISLRTNQSSNVMFEKNVTICFCYFKQYNRLKTSKQYNHPMKNLVLYKRVTVTTYQS